MKRNQHFKTSYLMIMTTKKKPQIKTQTRSYSISRKIRINKKRLNSKNSSFIGVDQNRLNIKNNLNSVNI